LLSKHEVQKILVTGHSLGAALATIIGLELKLANPKIEV
jgi:putative lipase involved disintegration of autophagic bodies